MATRLTDALRDLLVEQGVSPDNFAAEFDHWKSLGERGEYSSRMFGKDAAYAAPRVDGVPHTLRHVHLVPLKDADALVKWGIDWSRGRRKTSDRALVYVSDPYYGHLLLYILDEPSAHSVAKMQTPDDRELMEQFAMVAAHFIQTGEIQA